jgi:hypothetical protein
MLEGFGAGDQYPLHKVVWQTEGSRIPLSFLAERQGTPRHDLPVLAR